MIKKIIFIVVAIAALAGIGAIVYYGRETLGILQISPAPKEEKRAAPLPSQLETISSRPALDYVLPAGNDIFYVSGAGQLIKIDAAGKEEALSEGLDQPRLFASSPNGKEILIGFGQRDNFQLSRFIIADKIFKPINKSGIISAAWSPDSKKIAYLKLNSATGENDLFALDVSKEKQRSENNVSRASDYELEWPSPDRIVLKPRPSALYAASLLAVNPAKRPLLSAPLTGLLAKWSAALKQGLLFGGGERNNFYS